MYNRRIAPTIMVGSGSKVPSGYPTAGNLPIYRKSITKWSSENSGTHPAY